MHQAGGVVATGIMNECFQFKWSELWSKRSIALRELVPVVMACAIWGRQWAQQWVLVRTDIDQ